MYTKSYLLYILAQALSYMMEIDRALFGSSSTSSSEYTYKRKVLHINWCSNGALLKNTAQDTEIKIQVKTHFSRY